MPSSVAPLKNSTLLTLPSVSDALAAIAMLAGAVKLAPFAGLVTRTDGATFARRLDDGEAVGDDAVLAQELGIEPVPSTSSTIEPSWLSEMNIAGWLSVPPLVWPELPATAYTARCGVGRPWRRRRSPPAGRCRRP